MKEIINEDGSKIYISEYSVIEMSPGAEEIFGKPPEMIEKKLPILEQLQEAFQRINELEARCDWLERNLKNVFNALCGGKHV